MGSEHKVRTAAAALLTAISEARAVGLVIQWPSRPEGLASLSISATARASTTNPPVSTRRQQKG